MEQSRVSMSANHILEYLIVNNIQVPNQARLSKAILDLDCSTESVPIDELLEIRISVIEIMDQLSCTGRLIKYVIEPINYILQKTHGLTHHKNLISCQ